LELPGYYRSEKKWDLIALSGGELVAAMEFKSQVGPSFGNNFNNRCEEAIGSATDFWVAFREGRKPAKIRLSRFFPLFPRSGCPAFSDQAVPLFPAFSAFSRN